MMATPRPVSLTGSATMASSPASSRRRMVKKSRRAASASFPLPGLRLSMHSQSWRVT